MTEEKLINCRDCAHAHISPPNIDPKTGVPHFIRCQSTPWNGMLGQWTKEHNTHPCENYKERKTT